MSSPHPGDSSSSGSVVRSSVGSGGELSDTVGDPAIPPADIPPPGPEDRSAPRPDSSSSGSVAVRSSVGSGGELSDTAGELSSGGGIAPADLPPPEDSGPLAGISDSDSKGSSVDDSGSSSIDEWDPTRVDEREEEEEDEDHLCEERQPVAQQEPPSWEPQFHGSNPNTPGTHFPSHEEYKERTKTRREELRLLGIPARRVPPEGRDRRDILLERTEEEVIREEASRGIVHDYLVAALEACKDRRDLENAKTAHMRCVEEISLGIQEWGLLWELRFGVVEEISPCVTTCDEDVLHKGCPLGQPFLIC